MNGLFDLIAIGLITILLVIDVVLVGTGIVAVTILLKGGKK